MTYQQSRFLNLMEGYSDTIPLYEKSLQSAGQTQEKFNVYLESNEAAVNRLIDTWQGLWQSSFDSDLIKAGINALDLLAKGIKAVVDNFGLLVPTMGLVSTIFLASNNATRNAIMGQGMLSTSLVRTGDSMKIASGSARAYEISLYNLTLASRATTGAITMMGGALKTAGTFLARVALPVAGIMAVSWAIGKVTEKVIDHNQKLKELKQQQDEITKQYSSHSSEIDNLVTKYEQLNQAVESGTLPKNNEEYINTANRLNEIFPSITDHVDEQGNAHLRNIDAIKSEIVLAKELKDNYDKMTIANFEDNINEIFNKMSDARGKIIELPQNIESLPSSEMQKMLEMDRQSIQAKQDLIVLQQELQNAIVEQAKSYINASGSLGQLNGEDEQFIRNQIEQNKHLLESEQGVNQLNTQIKTYAKNIADLRGILGDGADLSGFNTISPQQTQVLSTLSTALNTGEKNWDKYAQSMIDAGFSGEQIVLLLETLKGNIEKTDQALNQNIPTFQNLQSEISSVNEDITLLSQAEKELQEEGRISQDTLDKLMLKYNDFGDALGLTKEELLKFITAKKSERTEFINTEIEKTNALIEESKKRLKALELEGNAYRKQLQGLVDSGIMTRSEMLSRVNANELYSGYADEIAKLGELQTRANYLKYTLENSNKIGLSSSGSKDKKSGSKDKDEAKINDVTDAIISQINAESRLAEARNNTTKETLDSLNGQQKYREQIELTNKLISGQEDQINKLTQANNNLHTEAQKVRAKTSHDTYKWFDDNLEASKQYIDLYNSLKTGSSQEQLQKLFDQLQKIKQAHRENSQSIQDLTKSTKEYEQELNNLQLTAMKSEYDSQLDDIDLLIQKNEILMDSMDETSSEYGNATTEQNKLIQQKIALTEQEIQKTLDLMSVQQADSLIMGELKERYEDLVIAQLQYEQQLKQQKREIANEIISIMKETYEKQKDLALDAIDEELDALEKAHDRKIEMLDEENDRIQESIDLKRKQIDQEESERDFTKQRGDLQKQLQELDNRIAIQDLDKSDESQAKVIDMRKERAKIVEEIDELQHDRQVELRQQNLDELSDDFKKEYDQKKKLEDDKYNKEKESIEKRKKLQEEYYDNLINNEREFARIREEIMDGNLSNIENQLGEFKEYIQDNMSSIGDSISQNLIDKIAQAEEQLANLNSMSGSVPSSSPTSNNSSNNKNTPEQEKLPSGWTRGSGGSLFTKDGSISYGVDENGYIYKNGNFVPAENYKYIPQEVIEMARKRKLKEFHVGGVVGGIEDKDSKLINSLFNIKPNEQIAKLLKGEVVVNPSIGVPNFINNMQNLLSGFKPQIAGIPTGDNYEINLNIKEFSGTKKEAESTAKTIMDILKRRGK